MNRDGKAVVTVIGLIGVLYLVTWFIGQAERVSPFLWLIPAAMVVAAVAIAVRYPSSRQYYVKAWQGVIEGFGSLADRASQVRFDRRAIKKDVKANVLNRSGRQCQYPRCPITNTKLLEVHHIDLNPAKSNDTNNLIVVCRNHHKRIQDDGVKVSVVRSWALNNVTEYARGRKVAGIRG